MNLCNPTYLQNDLFARKCKNLEIELNLRINHILILMTMHSPFPSTCLILEVLALYFRNFEFVLRIKNYKCVKKKSLLLQTTEGRFRLYPSWNHNYYFSGPNYIQRLSSMKKIWVVDGNWIGHFARFKLHLWSYEAVTLAPWFLKRVAHQNFFGGYILWTLAPSSKAEGPDFGHWTTFSLVQTDGLSKFGHSLNRPSNIFWLF